MNPIKWLLHKSIEQFERRYGYDAGYMHDVANVSPGAAVRMSFMPLLSQYRGPKPGIPVWAGAVFASTTEGDCGSCAQLIISMAKEAGVAPDALRECHEGNSQAAGAVGLGYRFARAAIAGDSDVAGLRQRIQAEFGERTLIAASYAAASGRWYPVLKRSLGDAARCERLDFDCAAATGAHESAANV